MSHVGLVTIVVDDYDEAINFYTEGFGFRLAEDSPRGDGSRFVIVEPKDGKGTALLLAKASTDAQRERIGDQTGGRVAFFLTSDDFAVDRERLEANGACFLEEPRHEAYGTVAVFQDICGNHWDLIEPAD